VDDISVEALLFQTGYLTIVDGRSDDFDTFYWPVDPNREVQTGRTEMAGISCV